MLYGIEKKLFLKNGQNDKHAIKRGVSLYSYQEEFFLQKMTLEDCIAAVAATGATGIEILGEQSIWGFPKLTDAFVHQWFGWMDKYGWIKWMDKMNGWMDS